MTDAEQLPGEVLFLPDPYCWWPQEDVRPYLGRPEYEVRIHRPASSPSAVAADATQPNQETTMNADADADAPKNGLATCDYLGEVGGRYWTRKAAQSEADFYQALPIHLGDVRYRVERRGLRWAVVWWERIEEAVA